MPRLRITITGTNGDRTDDLRKAAAVRRDLYAHSPVEVDPDGRANATFRNEKQQAYFELTTKYPDEVGRVLDRFKHSGYATVQEVTETPGPACENCGNVAGPVLPTVCPNCGFRDISPCAVCKAEIPRQQYDREAGDLHRCPNGHRVRLAFNNPMFLPDGSYNQPLVVVRDALQPAHV
jgi:DNA-directed RNA polymerase subunit RPC12/RpoP